MQCQLQVQKFSADVTLPSYGQFCDVKYWHTDKRTQAKRFYNYATHRTNNEEFSTTHLFWFSRQLMS